MSAVARSLAAAWSSLGKAYGPLVLVAEKQAKIGERLGRGSDGAAPFPLDYAAMSLADRVDSYALMLGRVMGRTGGSTPDLLKRCARALGESTWLDESTLKAFLDDARGLLGDIDRLLSPEPERRLLGHCPGCGAEAAAADSDLEGRCPRCGTLLDYQAMRVERADRLAGFDKLVTAGQASRLLAECGVKVSAHTVRQWASRSRLPVSATTAEGPVYSFAQVWALARRGLR